MNYRLIEWPGEHTNLSEVGHYGIVPAQYKPEFISLVAYGCHKEELESGACRLPSTFFVPIQIKFHKRNIVSLRYKLLFQYKKPLQES